jgi:GTP-binding protein
LYNANIMEIRDVRFVRGVTGSTDFLKDERPQIAFVGRSNVGKSSVINSLTQRKNLVRTSSTPGKTMEINFFLVNDTAYFVDLPGYGYAQHSQKRREKLRKTILWYLTSGEAHIATVVLIIDTKIGLRPFDDEMLDIAREEKLPVVVIANKIDKLNQSTLAHQKRDILAHVAAHYIDAEVIFYSSVTGRGRADVLAALDK